MRSRWLDFGQVLFCVFMEVSSPISSHLDRTSLVNKGFIIWPNDYTKECRICGNKARKTAWVANQNTGFTSSCPNAEPAIFTTEQAVSEGGGEKDAGTRN